MGLGSRMGSRGLEREEVLVEALAPDRALDGRARGPQVSAAWLDDNPRWSGPLQGSLKRSGQLRWTKIRGDQGHCVGRQSAFAAWALPRSATEPA